MSDAETTTSPETGDKPWYKKWWGIALIAVIVLAVIGSLTGEDTDPASAPEPAATETATDEQSRADEPAPADTEAAEEPAADETAADETAAEPTEEEPTAARGSFEAQEFSGSGDDVIDVSVPDDVPAILVLTHQGSANFIVQGHGEQGDFPDVLVNAIGNYDGTRPVNFGRTEALRELEIQADGPWTISLRPLSDAPAAEAGSSAGSGDAVVRVDGGGRGAFTHDGSANFIVEAYEDFGSFDGMPIVNEIGPYDGTVRVPSGTQVLVIQADGNWTFDIS